MTRFFGQLVALGLCALVIASCTAGGGKKKKVGAVGGASSGYALTFQVAPFMTTGEFTAYLVGHIGQFQLIRTGQGTYAFPTVEPGTYDLVIYARLLEAQGDNFPAGVYALRVPAIAVGEAQAKLGYLELPKAGGIRGKATTPDNATVTVKIVGTPHETTTNEAGFYAFADIPVGVHELDFGAVGFANIKVPGVDVKTGVDTTPDTVAFGDTSTATSTGEDDDADDDDDEADDDTDTGTGTETEESRLNGEIELAGGALVSNSRTVDVKLTMPVGAKAMKITETVTFPSEWVDLDTEFQHTFGGDGVKTLRVVFQRDDLTQTSPISAAISIDSVPPVISSMTVTGAVSGYTRSVNPSVLLAVADGDMLRVAATEEDLVFAEWVAFSNPYTGWDLTPPDTDGPRTLWMQVRDEALNPSETASVTVTLLREGPAMTEAKFSDSGYVTTATSTLSVTLDPGNVLPPVQVEYSCNAISYAVADWNAGSPALNVTSALAGCTAAQGARTVSVRLLDEIGNRGEIVAVPANLDNVAPAAPVITAPASCPVFVSTTPQTLTGTADPGSTITITGGFATATGTTTGGGTWSVPVGLKLNAPNNLTVTATDAAGNVGPGRTCTLRHDTVAPVFTDTTIELTATSVRVRWKTVGDNSTSVIEVRSREPIENYGTPVADSTLVEDHSIIFTGLSKNRKYEYRVSSTDQAGNTTVGPDVEFITYEAVPNVFYTGTRTMSETRTPYYSSGSFSIFPNTTLIISPGVTVAFGPNASIVIEGTLKAQGTALDPVTFTTNSPTPTPGAWDAIRFMHTCSDSTFTGQGVTKDWATGSILEHVVVEYGGGDADTGTSEHGAIEGMRCDVAIRDTVVRQSKHDGIYWYGGDQAGDTGTLVLRDSTLADNLGRGLFVETESSDSAMHAWVVSNRFSRNGDFGFSSHLADSLFIARNVFEANGGGAYVESAVTSLFDNVADSNTGSGYVFRSGIDGPATTAAYGNSAIRNTAANGAAFRDDNEDDKSQWITMGSFLVWGNTALDDDGASIALSKGRDESDAFLGTRWNSAGGSIFGNTGDWAVATKIEFPNSASAAYILDTYWNRALGTEISAFLVFDGADAPGTYGFVPFGDETDPKEFHVLPSMVAPLSPPISVAAAPAGAGAFTVSWTEGPEPDIAGHYVHYGATGDWPYDQTVDTGGVGSCSSVTVNSVALGDRCRTTCTISGVAAGVTHVAVTSYDALREVYVRVEPAAINAGSNQITATAHGFTDDWRVRVQAWDETGAVDARLPGGLDRCTDYYVNVVDANTLELSATVGGLPVDLTDQGVDLLQITAVEKAASLTRGAAAVAATDLDRTTGAMISTAGGFSGDVQGSFSLADCSAGFPLGVSPTDEYWLVPGYRTDAPAGQYTLSRVRGGPPVSLSGADSFAFSLAEVSAANDTITIAEHGLQTQTQVQFDVVDPLLDTLPAELAPPPAVFYVERVNVNAIKVRATRCGAAIDITDPGVGNFTMTVPADQVDGVGNLSFTPNAATSTVTRGAWRTDGHESWYSSDVTVTVP